MSMTVDQVTRPTPRGAAVLVIVALMALGLVSSDTSSRNGLQQASRPPAFSHIWVIFMENHDYTQVIRNPEAPHINQLADMYGLATQYFGVAHGSQPNYIAFFSGNQYGVTGGSTPNLDASNLVDQLEAHDRSWHVYAENFPGNCFNGITSSGGADGPGTYVRRHVPAMAFRDIRRNPQRCSKVTNLSSFDPAAADFELIVPNLTNDMHDGTIRQGDNFLRSFVPRITGSAAWKQNGALFIVWDEGREKGANRVPLLVIAPLVAPRFRSDLRHDHYSLLRTIEDAWNLGCLGNACTATDLGEFFAHPPRPSG
jgi:phosphatidylinositol-3-phosphatase